MADSKTARASMVKEVKEKPKEESTEEAIRQLRLNLAAGLWVTPDRIKALLAAYDKILAEAKVLAEAGVAMIQHIIPEAILSADSVKMAELPAQEHDEHHMSEFGHHTTHQRAEGA